LRKIQNKCAISRSFAPGIGLLLAAAAALMACDPAADPEPGAVLLEEEPLLLCGNDGELRADLYGAISTQLCWSKNDLECTGMRRPGGRGARLRFAGDEDGAGQRLAVIIALPDLTRGTQGNEFGSNVTVIQEGIGRFFSTPDINNCLTDITSLLALDDSGDRFSIAGVLYCMSPLPEINGDSSVSIPELHFSGLIDWGAT
jgi:hypothetical protein